MSAICDRCHRTAAYCTCAASVARVSDLALSVLSWLGALAVLVVLLTAPLVDSEPQAPLHRPAQVVAP